MNQDDKLVCPICGTEYKNGLDEQLNITSDYANCENLINKLKNSISVSIRNLENIKEKYIAVGLEIQSLEQQIENMNFYPILHFIRIKVNMRYMILVNNS